MSIGTGSHKIQKHGDNLGIIEPGCALLSLATLTPLTVGSAKDLWVVFDRPNNNDLDILLTLASWRSLRFHHPPEADRAARILTGPRSVESEAYAHPEQSPTWYFILLLQNTVDNFRVLTRAVHRARIFR